MDSSLEGPSPSLFWNKRRSAIRDWLGAYSRPLAEFYEAAVRLMYGPAIPARVCLLSHTVRDIRNQLPHALSRSTALRGRVEYANRLSSISRRWNRSAPTAVGTSGAATPTSLGPKVELDRDLFLAFAQLIEEHEHGKHRKEHNAALLFESIAPENKRSADILRPAIYQWIEVTDWFEGRAHLSLHPLSTEEAELAKRFEIFEVALGQMARVESFYETTGDLDAILEQANN
jgi:hypothetical protein